MREIIDRPATDFGYHAGARTIDMRVWTDGKQDWVLELAWCDHNIHDKILEVILWSYRDPYPIYAESFSNHVTARARFRHFDPVPYIIESLL